MGKLNLKKKKWCPFGYLLVSSNLFAKCDLYKDIIFSSFYVKYITKT